MSDLVQRIQDIAAYSQTGDEGRLSRARSDARMATLRQIMEEILGGAAALRRTRRLPLPQPVKLEFSGGTVLQGSLIDATTETVSVQSGDAICRFDIVELAALHLPVGETVQRWVPLDAGLWQPAETAALDGHDGECLRHLLVARQLTAIAAAATGECPEMVRGEALWRLDQILQLRPRDAVALRLKVALTDTRATPVPSAPRWR